MQQKKTIVIGINDLCLGGAQRQLIRQLQYFDTKRYALHIVTLFACGARTDLATQVPATVTVHPLAFRGIADVRSWLQLVRLLRTIKPDLVMTSLFFSNTVFRALALFLRYPVIAREHNTYTEKSHVQIWIDRMLAQVSEKIVAVSDEVADFTSRQERIAREQFVVIENGIDVEEIVARRKTIDRAAVRTQLGMGPEEKVLLSVGRLVAQKNLALLIEGFAQFCVTQPGWKLVIVGEGSERKELETQAAAHEVGDTVVFVGEQQDVHPYYVASDAYVSTSHIEGMSNTQLEALAHGLPIVSTATGGTGKMVQPGRNGYLIQNTTPHAVAAALRELATSDLSALGAVSQEISRQFTIRQTVERYESLFAQYAA